MRAMKMKNWVSAVAAFAFACQTVTGWCAGVVKPGGDSVREIERTASVYHSYEFEPIADTPPPDGFKPFYISHYGRHGSRRISGSAVTDVMRALEKANKGKALTETGRALLDAVRKIAAVHDDMEGQLTERGAWEHRQLARRMADRFPEVFARPRRVHCRSSVSPRVLTSQANFTMALKGVAPQLEFDFATGVRHHKIINPLHWARLKKPEIATRTEELSESLAKSGIDPKPLIGRLFTAGGEPKKPIKFAQALFECASICQCCREELDGLDIYRFFEAGEIEALSRAMSARHYLVMGNSEEFGEFVSSSEAKLAHDMAARAEAAIADDRIAADLRFGHDSGLWPLAGFLDLEGPGDRVKAADAPSACPSWKWLPMAANFQMILYRNASGEVLVKFLWNEREMRVRGVTPVSGPYYKWSDIRPRMEGDASPGNPIFEGWYADPQIRKYGNEYWVFPTASDSFRKQTFFDAFSSSDLKTWKKHPRILTTNEVTWARGAMWAPDAHEVDGKYYFFFSANDSYPVSGRRVDGEPKKQPGLQGYGGIGVAVADRPEGPYRDLIGKPLIDRFWNGAQPIDQYAFEYKGDWYMVYGGWGRCNLVKLAKDFKSLVPFEDGSLWRDFTPKGYVEGSVMFERKGKWYFMYSCGGWTRDDYCVNYSVGDTPFGPFEFKGKVLGVKRPLATGAGHHSVICVGNDEWRICYHRRPIPNKSPHHRVVCIDRMEFDANGNIKPIEMTK